MADIAVIPIERLELAFVPRPWPFADQQRDQIRDYFATRRQDNPAFWNGRVLVLGEHSISNGVFRGSYFESDFASFLAWRDWGAPDPSVKDSFAQGALRSTDRAFLLGVQALHTSNPGCIYFPSGMPDVSDVMGTTVDLEGSVWREVAEEVGLTRQQLAAEPGWYTVLDGPRIAHIKILQAQEDASALQARILEFLAREQTPELSDIRIARDGSDPDPMTQPFVSAFLDYIFR